MKLIFPFLSIGIKESQHDDNASSNGYHFPFNNVHEQLPR